MIACKFKEIVFILIKCHMKLSQIYFTLIHERTNVNLKTLLTSARHANTNGKIAKLKISQLFKHNEQFMTRINNLYILMNIFKVLLPVI